MGAVIVTAFCLQTCLEPEPFERRPVESACVGVGDLEPPPLHLAATSRGRRRVGGHLDCFDGEPEQVSGDLNPWRRLDE
jgi:hypothetical protein